MQVEALLAEGSREKASISELAQQLAALQQQVDGAQEVRAAGRWPANRRT